MGKLLRPNMPSTAVLDSLELLCRKGLAAATEPLRATGLVPQSVPAATRV